MTFGELPLQAQGALVILGLLLVKPIAMVLIDAWDGFCAWGERRRNAGD